MDLSRHFSRGRACGFCGLVFCLATTAFSGRAQENNKEAIGVEAERGVTNQPALKVDVRRNIEGTFIPYRYAFVTAGAEKHTFLVPESYRVDTSDPTRIKLASQDFSAMITLGLVGGFPPGAKMSEGVLRERVLANYSEATINLEQSINALGQFAPAVDFTWKADSSITRKTRIICVPTASGLMEFNLTASPEKFDACLPELNLVMLTFRSSSNGKFDYVVGSKYP